MVVQWQGGYEFAYICAIRASASTNYLCIAWSVMTMNLLHPEDLKQAFDDHNLMRYNHIPSNLFDVVTTDNISRVFEDVQQQPSFVAQRMGHGRRYRLRSDCWGDIEHHELHVGLLQERCLRALLTVI